MTVNAKPDLLIIGLRIVGSRVSHVPDFQCPGMVTLFLVISAGGRGASSVFVLLVCASYGELQWISPTYLRWESADKLSIASVAVYRRLVGVCIYFESVEF